MKLIRIKGEVHKIEIDDRTGIAWADGKLVDLGQTDYDLDRDFPKAKRKRRISAITGKATGLTPELELQIAAFVFYDKLCRVDRDLAIYTRLYAVNPIPGKTRNHAMLSKRAGLRAGIWDAVFLDRRAGELEQSWLEFKSNDGGLTEAQQDWFDWLEDTEIRFYEIRSVNEFTRALNI